MRSGSLESAIECYRGLGETLQEGDTMRSLSDILWCPGRSAEARSQGLAAVALLETRPSGRELALAYANLSFLCGMSLEHNAAREWSAKAMAIANEVGDAETRTIALLRVGNHEGALQLARREDLQDLVPNCLLGLAAGVSYRRDYERACGYIDAGIDRLRAPRIRSDARYFLAEQAQAQLDQGRRDEAAQSAAQVLRLPAVSTSPASCRSQCSLSFALAAATRTRSHCSRRHSA